MNKKIIVFFSIIIVISGIILSINIKKNKVENESNKIEINQKINQNINETYVKKSIDDIKIESYEKGLDVINGTNYYTMYYDEAETNEDIINIFKVTNSQYSIYDYIFPEDKNIQAIITFFDKSNNSELNLAVIYNGVVGIIRYAVVDNGKVLNNGKILKLENNTVYIDVEIKDVKYTYMIEYICNEEIGFAGFNVNSKEL